MSELSVPPLPSEFETVFHPYADKTFIGTQNSRRIASWCPLRSTSPDYYAVLPLNLPHYYRVPSIFGYDPIVDIGQSTRLLSELKKNNVPHDSYIVGSEGHGMLYFANRVEQYSRIEAFLAKNLAPSPAGSP